VAGDDGAIDTPRLRLRRFRLSDLEALVRLDADPEVMRFITGGAPTPRDEIERDVLPALMAPRGDGYGYFAAEERGSGALVGWFHLRPAVGAPADEPELGYRLRRSAWGSGLATEGARALVDHAFSSLGAQRVVAETMVVHSASRRVLEKAGLRVVRHFHADWPYRIEGEEHGDVEYALTREEWARGRPGD
jgi:RimJ/RimL family protein N-acetyltransferase